jgi:F-type H+-transporting ATPase subunit gamma
MGNLKEIRNRIVSVKSTQQITRAMKMVSAAKLKKATDAIVRIRPYSYKLKEVIETLAEGIEDLHSNPYYDNRPELKVLLIPVTSDKGLCGSYNTNIIRETQRQLNLYKNRRDKRAKLDLLCIGKKGAEYFKKHGYNVIHSYTNMSVHTKYETVEEIATWVLDEFRLKEYDSVKFIYNTFKNAAVYYTTLEKFLPIETEPSKKKSFKNSSVNNFIFEPTEDEIISELIPTSLKVNFFRVVLESIASEHGARMTAMDNATENAEELIGELLLGYNKARQANITNEILEIVSGANALREG